MASAGIRKHTSTRTGRISYEVWWRLDDGSQGSKSFAKKADAIDYRGRVLTEAAAGRLDRRRASLRFREWVEDWWATWSTNPNRSPNTLVMTESRLRRYIRPHFDGRLVRSISVRDVQHWQNGLEATVGYDTVMACRSVLFRVLQAAEDEGIVPANPVCKVPAPKRLVDPEVIFGRVKRRTLTPEEAGILLARFPRFWWDHVITLLGTGLRIGEFTGLQRRRVDLAHGRLEVVETRYEAGKYGTGIKNRPKSPAGIRELPIPRQVADAIARQLPPGTDPSALVFSGPGGAAWRRRGERTVLSRFNVRRLYHQAVGRAAAGAAKTGGSGLAHLDLHGPHDLRHTYATWLEEEGIPVRVIDELMGHRAGSRGDRGGSSIGRRYRHTTPEMRDRVLAVLEIRLAITLEVANRLVEV